MTYKSKFEASEHRAHYQNIATKILREMSDLRSLVESSPIAPRRWIWELIQNAKDVHSIDGVKIIIEYHPNIDSPYINFKHNGKPFSADNIRFLIEQISTKDRKKDGDGKRKTTGKFGTGFLTTHLLSEKVTVKGIAKEPELDYRKFTLELDRSGFEIEQITDAVQKAKLSVIDLDESPQYSKYVEGEFNTEFIFPLTDSVSLKVANLGLNDINNCLPYTLAFVKEINSIEILPSCQIFQNTDNVIHIGENINLISLITKNKEESNNITIVFLQDGLTNIAVPIKKEGSVISLLPIHDKTPRLFCDFPLIGTEKFHFPVIINNPNFNPTDPRDGVFLTTPERTNPLIEENKTIIKEAVNLYFQLLEFAVNNNWGNLHLLAQIRPLFDLSEWVDENWYKDEILTPIRKKLLYAKIINNSNGDLASILTDKGKKYIWFPNSGKKDIRNKIWQLANFWFPRCLPQETDVELWYKLSWNECGKLDLEQLATFIENKKTLEELSSEIEGKDIYEWLNEFYSLLELEENDYNTIINNRAIFPNQNGAFCKKSHLYKEKGSIEEEFKNILSLLNKDIRGELIDQNIELSFEEEDTRDQSFLVREINSEINEKANDREIAKDFSKAFKTLLFWFQEHPEKAKSLFQTLYRNKHLLYDDDEIMDNITKAEQLSDLLDECNAKDINELRELIITSQESKDNLLPITQEILVSMGISSIEEWEEAIKDKI